MNGMKREVQRYAEKGEGGDEWNEENSLEYAEKGEV